MNLESLIKKYLVAEPDAENKTDDALRMRMTNIIIISIYAILIPYIIYEAINKMYYNVITDVCFLFLIGVSYLIIRSGRYVFGRNMILFAVNLLFFLGNLFQGLGAGNYLYYLPLIIVFSLLLSVKDKSAHVITIFIITILFAFGSILFCPQVSKFQNISVMEQSEIFKINFCLCVLLTVIFSYINYRITQLKQAELIKAKELAEQGLLVKSRFLSNMSHELRTPLNGIIGTVNLLTTESFLNEQEEHLNLLKYSSEHMLSLINEVLDFSKIEADKVVLENQTFRIKSFLENISLIYKRQAEAKGLQYEFELVGNDTLNVIGDTTRLGQILHNLLSNALKFTEKGKLKFLVNIKEIAANKVELFFSVKDSGIGIAEEKIAKIFNSFEQADINTTRKYGGTGLGLSISKRLTSIFGGELQLESKIGVGSHFYFTIQFNKGKNVVVTTENKEDSYTLLKGKKVLLAEDNPINVIVAKKILQKWGVDLIIATNGREAIDMFSQSDFEILLIDLEMPEVDGYGVLQAVRKINPKIPAIAFTASSFENIDIYLKNKGFNCFVPKPFMPKLLYDKMVSLQAVELVY